MYERSSDLAVLWLMIPFAINRFGPGTSMSYTVSRLALRMEVIRSEFCPCFRRLLLETYLTTPRRRTRFFELTNPMFLENCRIESVRRITREPFGPPRTTAPLRGCGRGAGCQRMEP